jgi:hypothetical protein
MTWKTLFRRAFPAAAALVALAALAPVPLAAGELVCRASSDYCAEVNGAYVPAARFFVTDTKGRFLVDIPSLSMSVLINRKTKKAVAVPRSSIKHEAADGVVRLAVPIPSDAPGYALSIDGPVLRFQVDTSEVRVLKASSCQPIVMPIWTAAPVTDDSSARRCLHQEARPLSATPSCMKGAYVKNSCDVPVVAVVRSTQHLFSGTLPETSTIVLPPGVEHSLGCVWSSGAMAPSVYELRAAGFLPRPPVSEARDRGATEP